jgi:hypothetical protein
MAFTKGEKCAEYFSVYSTQDLTPRSQSGTSVRTSGNSAAADMRTRTHPTALLWSGLQSSAGSRRKDGLNSLLILIILEADTFRSAPRFPDVQGMLLASSRVFKKTCTHCAVFQNQSFYNTNTCTSRRMYSAAVQVAVSHVSQGVHLLLTKTVVQLFTLQLPHSLHGNSRTTWIIISYVAGKIPYYKSEVQYYSSSHLVGSRRIRKQVTEVPTVYLLSSDSLYRCESELLLPSGETQCRHTNMLIFCLLYHYSTVTGNLLSLLRK